MNLVRRGHCDCWHGCRCQLSVCLFDLRTKTVSSPNRNQWCAMHVNDSYITYKCSICRKQNACQPVRDVFVAIWSNGWSECSTNEIIMSKCVDRMSFWWRRWRADIDGVVWIEMKFKWGVRSNLPRDKIFLMFRLIAELQFHRRCLNWYSHSRNPMLMPRAISSISDVSVLQISCNLPRKRRGFLHIKCGSSNKLVPSALERNGKRKKEKTGKVNFTYQMSIE